MRSFGALSLAGLLLASVTPGIAQNATISQKMAQVKQMLAENQMQLARYTWQMQETVSVDGSVKKQDLYQVVSGPGGQTRTLVAQPVAPSGGRQHGIIHRIKEDYADYAQQVGAVAKSYTPIDPGKLKLLYAQGSVSLKSAGSSGYSEVVIRNYNKPGDKVVLTISDNPKELYAINVSSYLDQPSNYVNMQVRFATLPDGTHYAQTVTVSGAKRNLIVVDQSMNFVPRQ